MNYIGTQSLKTQRLLLRRITMLDAEDMYNNWASDDEVTKYLTWKPHSSIYVTKTIISTWIDELKSKECYRWCIELQATHQVIGCIDVVQMNKEIECATIGYCMSKSYWNQGIMTEALIAVQNFLFSVVGFNRVEAYHDVMNPASGKVMQKAGMRFEGIKRDGLRNRDNQFIDVAIYAILKSDWEQKPE